MENPRWNPTWRGNVAASWANSCSNRGSPLPSTTSWKPWRWSSPGIASPTRAKPFWPASRDTMPITGTPGTCGSPNRSTSAALQIALPERSAAV